MRNKKGNWMSWFWIILFLLIIPSILISSAIRHSYYRQSIYDDLTGKITDNYNEELQRQQEQQQYEDMLREQQRQEMYEDELRRQQYEEELRRQQYEDELRRGIYGDYPQQTEESTKQLDYFEVSKIIDGDTIKLSTGEELRLIGLNAPESGQACSLEATEKLRDFVLGKEVTLESDIDNKDQYNRLLRYVYVGDVFVNLEMVRLGFAHKYEYGSNTKYSSQFEQAENEAKQNEGCLWKSEDIDYIQDQCIYITNFHFNAAGDDNYNLNDEYITFGNKCSYSIDMTNWTIKDETASHLYTIPSLTFQSGSTFTLFTGTGTNTNSALYWGRTSGNYAAIWNNNGGDTLFLRDSNGNLVLTQSYSGY